MRLIVGNVLSEEYGFDAEQLSPEAKVSERCTAFQMLWSARAGDLVILPDRPDDALLAYVTGLTGVDPLALRFAIPPADPGNEDILTRERLLDPGFLSVLRRELAGREVAEICAQVPDSTVARFARDLGLPEALPGYALLAQRGAVLVNSKAAFRAIAAGGPPFRCRTAAYAPDSARRSTWSRPSSGAAGTSSSRRISAPVAPATSS
jgi:hypothetical protein